MNSYKPLMFLPFDIQRDWLAGLDRRVQPAADGHFYLVEARRTDARGYQGQRITVLVVDENGFPLPNVRVAFSFSTAPFFLITEEFKWLPPPPYKAFVTTTDGGGQIDQVQGSAVKAGQPGGVTVYLLEANYSSDVVSGLGMLSDHTGLHLTFQLRRHGVLSLADRFARIEERLDKLETKTNAVAAVITNPVWGQPRPAVETPEDAA